MKKWMLVCLYFCAFSPLQAEENPDAKDQVIALEKKMAVALVENDVETLRALWAEDFLVNNPANTVLSNRAEVMERVDAGIIRYDLFEQSFEEVRSYQGIVLVMGEEKVRPIGNAPGAGNILRRRFTNVWMLREGRWSLTARHANVIPPPKP